MYSNCENCRRRKLCRVVQLTWSAAQGGMAHLCRACESDLVRADLVVPTAPAAADRGRYAQGELW